MTIEAYDPRLLEAWRRAPTEPVRIPVRTKSQAVTLRHRLYRLRAELRKTNHPLIASAERAKVSIISYSRDRHEVVIAPVDDEFDDALRAADLEVPPPEALTPLDEPETAPDPLEEILSRPAAARDPHQK